MIKKDNQYIKHDIVLVNFLNSLRENPKFIPTFRSYTEKNFKASDTGQSYRTLNSWDTAGLLLNLQNTENKWRKFSIVEILWIQVVKELRSLGFSKKKIQKLKTDLFPIDKETGRSDTKRFEQYIISVVAEREVMLIVFPDGSGDFAIEVELIQSQLSEKFPTTYTVININKLCALFTGNDDYNKKKPFPYYPNIKEKELLNEIGSDDTLKEVELKINDKKITRINYKKQHQNPRAVMDALRKAINQGGRHEITLKVENGKVVYIENIDKK